MEQDLILPKNGTFDFRWLGCLGFSQGVHTSDELGVASRGRKTSDLIKKLVLI